LVISDETPLDLRTTNITRLDTLANQAATHMSFDARFPSYNKTFRRLQALTQALKLITGHYILNKILFYFMRFYKKFLILK